MRVSYNSGKSQAESVGPESNQEIAFPICFPVRNQKYDCADSSGMRQRLQEQLTLMRNLHKNHQGEHKEELWQLMLDPSI